MKSMIKEAMVRKNQVGHVRAERDVLAVADNPWIVTLHYSFQDDHVSGEGGKKGGLVTQGGEGDAVLLETCRQSGIVFRISLRMPWCDRFLSFSLADAPHGDGIPPRGRFDDPPDPRRHLPRGGHPPVHG